MEIMFWIVLVGMAVAMYLIIYKYERKMEALEQKIHENRAKLDEHHEKISKNYNHIQKMWVSMPKVESEGEEEG